MQFAHSYLGADEASVAPAAEIVSASSSEAEAELFGDETYQLTDDVIANLTSLNLTAVDMFSFSNGEEYKRSTSTCKVMPGDKSWPSEMVWTVFDLLLGGALTKTTPLASVCYTNWGDYDASKCSSISANWSNDSYMQ